MIFYIVIYNFCWGFLDDTCQTLHDHRRSDLRAVRHVIHADWMVDIEQLIRVGITIYGSRLFIEEI
jgi:hypothetical protein